MTTLLDYHLLNGSLIVGALVFAVGGVGFLARRSLPVMLLSAALMFQAVLVVVGALGGFHGAWSGRALLLLLLPVGLAQAGVLYAVTAAFVRREGSTDVSRWRCLGAQGEPVEETDAGGQSSANAGSE